MNRVTIAIASFGALCVAAIILFSVVISIDAGAGARSLRNVSRAMEPALLAGDLFTVRRWSPQSLRAISRGVVIVHRFPLDPTKQFVKRVVGLPGDTVAMVRGAFRINGRLLAEPYAWNADSASDPTWDDFKWQRDYLAGPSMGDTSHYRPSRNNWGPIAVPSGHFFVLGDNRDNSLDSRYWGFLTATDIVGQPRRVYFSRDPETGRIRWSRIGHRLQ
jgi:signal peptidase I